MIRKCFILLVLLLLCIPFIYGGCGGGEDEDIWYYGPQPGDTNGNCQGCCSSHGGVVCRSDGETACADGSDLSDICAQKGCGIIGCGDNIEPTCTLIHQCGDYYVSDEKVLESTPVGTTIEGRRFFFSYNDPANYPVGSASAGRGVKLFNCEPERDEWGFQLIVFPYQDENLSDFVANYFPDVQVVINSETFICPGSGTIHDGYYNIDQQRDIPAQFRGNIWMPIDWVFDNMEGLPCGDEYARIKLEQDPFYQHFHKIERMFLDGLEIDLSNRLY